MSRKMIFVDKSEQCSRKFLVHWSHLYIDEAQALLGMMKIGVKSKENLSFSVGLKPKTKTLTVLVLHCITDL